MNGSRYLLVKSRAGQLPLRDNSVGLVIATPPMLGVRHRPKADYCTSDAEEYEALITRFLSEATRVVQPRRHILLTDCQLQDGKTARPIIFLVLQKQPTKSGWVCRRIGEERFLTHFVDVKGFPWWAISRRIYRSLIRKYSERGEIIAHVFSGSGNGAMAAMQLQRRPVMIDLHYHRQVRRRIERTTKKMAQSSCKVFAS